MSIAGSHGDVGEAGCIRVNLDDGGTQSGSETCLHRQPFRPIDSVTQRLGFVGLDVVLAVVNCPVGPQNADVTVASAAQVVEDSGSNRALDELHGLSFSHAFLPARLHHGHRS